MKNNPSPASENPEPGLPAAGKPPEQTRITEFAKAEDIQLLVQELEAQKNELEMQNEELRRNQEELAASRQRFFDLYDLAPFGYLTLNEQGMILEANHTAADLLGKTPNHIVNKPLSNFIFSEDQETYYFHRKNLLANGKQQECELRMVKTDGNHFWAHLVASIIQNCGREQECRVTFSDISALKESSENLETSERKYRDLFNTLQEGLALHKLVYTESGNAINYRIIDANPAFEKIIGRKASDTVNRLATDLYRTPKAPYLEDYARVVETGITHTFETYFAPLGKYFRIVVFSPGAGLFATLFEDITESRQAEQRIAASESELRALFAAMHDVVINYDAEGRYLKIAPTNPENFTRSPEKMLGKTVSDVLPEEKAAYVLAKIRETLEKGAVVTAEYSLEISGKEIWFSANVSPLSDNTVIWVAHDITERMQAEEEIQTSEARFRAIFEQAAVGVAQTETETGRYIHINQKYCDLLGYTQEEMLKKRFQDVTYPEDMQSNVDNLNQLMTGKINQFSVEKRYIRKDGSVMWGLLTASPIWNPGEKPGANFHIGIVEDITERKQAEVILRESEELMHYIVKYDPNAIAVYDRNLHYIAVSDRYLKDYNVKEQDIIGRHHYEVFPEMPQKWKDVHQRCLAGAIEREDNDQFERPDGSITYNRWECRPWHLANGEIGGIITYTEVITGRKQAEEALRRSEEKFRSMFYDNNAIMLLIDTANENIIDANPAACKYYGWTLEELTRKKITDINTLSGGEVKEEIQKAISKKTESFHFRHRLASGEIREVEVFTNPLLHQGKILLYSIIQDITERKLAEKALHDLSTRQEAILAAVPDIIMEVDNNKMYTWANQAGFDFFGEDVIGKEASDFFEGDQKTYSGVQPLFDGTKNAIYIESWQRRKDGQNRLLSWWCRALDDENGKVIGAISSARDITEPKQTEEKLAQTHELLTNLARLVPGVIYQYRLYPDGRSAFPYASPGMNDIYEVSPDDVQEDATPVFGRLHPDDYDRVANSILESARTLQEFYCEFRVILPRQGLRWRWSQAHPERTADGGTLWHGIISDITELKKTEEALIQSRETLRALSVYWQTAIEAERTTIAREIHDEFGQSMTALKMDLTWLANRLPEGDERVARILGMNTLVDDSINLMRRIATTLRPSLLDDLGLTAALEWQAHEFSDRTGIPCSFNLPHQDLNLDSVLSTSIFRIFQETLTNVTRHANATQVNISLELEGQILVLTIQDNGRGITESQSNDRNSLGLLGLRERAAMSGGSMEISGAPGKGTTVTARIPLPASPASGGKP